MCYFRTIFNFGYTKANQTCQRTKRLFMTDLLQNGFHENVKQWFLVNSWKNKDMIKIIDAFRTLVSIRFLLRQDL